MGAGAPPPNMPMPPQSPQEMQPSGPGMADGGMVAFAQGGQSRSMNMQSLLPFPEAGLPDNAGFAEGGVAALPIPDDMFNSSVGDSDTQQYADGGMVAFDSGGGVYDKFRQAIVERESRGDYGARNKQSGAMGKYQVMPATAAALAKRMGMEYNPALMTSDTDAGKAYQDAIGNAAMKEAWNYGGGDAAKAAGYYQGGPNTKIHGAENRKYQTAIAGRMGQDAPQLAASSTAPAGLAAASVPNDDMEAMRAQMLASAEDRAADKKDRKRAGWASLAQQGLAMMSPSGAGTPSLFADGGTVHFAAGTLDPYSQANTQAEMAKQGMLAPSTHEFSGLAMENIRKDLADQKTERKQAANMALMNFGLALMSSKNPNFLGAVGEAGAPAVAGMKADLNNLKKEARDSIIEAAKLEDYSNKERRELANAATAHITNVVAAKTQANQFEATAEAKKTESDLDRTSRENIAKTVAASRDTMFDQQFKIARDNITSRLKLNLPIILADGTQYTPKPGKSLTPESIDSLAAAIATAAAATARGGAGTGVAATRSLIEGRGGAGQQAQGGTNPYAGFSATPIQ